MRKAYRLFSYPILLLKIPRGSLDQTTRGDIKHGRGYCRGDTSQSRGYIVTLYHSRGTPTVYTTSHTSHGRE